MIKKLIIVAALACSLEGSAQAVRLHGSMLSAGLPAGIAQENVGGSDLNNAQVFTNILNSTNVQFGGTAGTTLPPQDTLDSNSFMIKNYPVPGSGSISGQLGQISNSTLGTAGPWTFGWDATKSCFEMSFGVSGTASVLTGAGIVISNPGGVGNLDIQSNCAATTGTTHGTTVVDSLASTTGLFVGQIVSASDITASQTVSSINTGCPTSCTGSYVVLSAIASGSNVAEAVTFKAPAGTITITWTNNSGQKSWNWNSFYTNYALNTPDTGRMYMCRSANTGWNNQSDCVAYLAGQQWTTEYVALMKNLNPKYVRTMGWDLVSNGQTSNLTKWSYRGSVNRFSMSAASAYPIGARAGGGPYFGNITGSGGQYTAPAATDTPLGSWTDGEVISGNVVTGAGGLQVSNVVPGIGNNCQVSVQSVAVTGTTNGTTTVSAITSTAGMYTGMPVYAADFPTGAVIASVGTGSITLSIAATGSNANEAITGGTVTGIQIGPIYIDNINGLVQANGIQTVTAVNTGTNTITLSTGGACAGTFIGQITTFGSITAGTGGTAGTYTGVALTGGSGAQASANIVVAGGGVTSVSITSSGTGQQNYKVGDVISAASASIGNTTGFSAVVTGLVGGSIAYQTLTITGKSGGSKLIVQDGGFPINANSAQAYEKYVLPASAGTFIYSSKLDRVIYCSCGIATSVPPEAQIQFANDTSSGLWYNYGTWATDDFITQLTTLAKNTLTSKLPIGLELCNENWNGSFICGQQIGNAAIGVGLATWGGGNSSLLPWQALRTTQVGIIGQSVFGNRTQFQNLYMWQGGSGLNNNQINAPLTGSSISGVIAVAGIQTSGSNTIVGLQSISGLFAGEIISGSGIPSNTTISTVTAPATITISANATSTVNGNAYTITGGIGTSRYQTYIGAVAVTGNSHTTNIIDGLSSVVGLSANMPIAGSGIPAFTIISAVNSGCTNPCITISNATTSSVSGVTVTAIPGYNASPNRPIDYVDGGGYAPYMGPPGLIGQSPDIGNTAPTVADLPNLQTIGDNYIAGNSSVAYATINALIADGGVALQNITAASGTTFTTPIAHGFTASSTLIGFSSSGGTAYSGVNIQALYRVDSVPSPTTFTAQLITNGTLIGGDISTGTPGTGTTFVSKYEGNAVGLKALATMYYTKWQAALTGFSPAPAVAPKMLWYEGSIEVTAPTTAQATTIGLVTPSIPVTTIGSTHASSVVDNITSVTGLYPGQVVSATDITSGQLILTINSGCPTTCTGNYVVMNTTNSGTNANESVTFTGTAALASTTITNAVLAWKLDLTTLTSRAAEQLYFSVYLGTNPNYITSNAMSASAGTSNLVFMGSPVNTWSLTNNVLPQTPQVYGFYCGFQNINGAPPTAGC